VKRELALALTLGVLSSARAQAFQGLAARLSLDRPYREEGQSPGEETGRRMHFRQPSKPVPFNIFHYLLSDKTGFRLAVYFK